VLLRPKLKNLKSQASVGVQELKIEKARADGKKSVPNMLAVCSYLYDQCVASRRASLVIQCVASGRAPFFIDCCYSSKEKVFFRTFGLRPSSISQSEFIILTN
jgi:hypothetical protein